MKNIYLLVSLALCLFITNHANAQIIISPVVYPQYCTDSSTGGRLPYVFRAKLSGMTANTLYRFYVRAASLSVDGNNGGGGAAIFIKQNGNFTYVPNPNMFNAGFYDTIRSNSSGEVSAWFSFEPARGTNSRFTEGNYVHARFFIQPNAGGGPGGATIITISDSIRVIRYGSKPNNITGIHSTSLSTAKDMVFLYDNIAGNGRPLTGAWLETDGLNFKSGTGAGGSPNATSYPGYYRNNVDTITAAWGSFIPNSLSAGMQRVERRKLSDGTIGWSNTDADGIWDLGTINTVNTSGGLTALNIATDDAPLINVPPKISFVNATQSVTENSGSVTIGIGLKFPSTSATSVDITVTSGSATSGSDYTYSTQTVTFPANSTTVQNITISISNDANAESLETVILGLSNFTNSATAGVNASTTLTIIDDDTPYITFASASSSGLENITTVNIPVNIQFPTSAATSVDIAVSGGSATLGTDYTFSNQTITFPASSSSPISVPVTIINDAVTEGDETIVFTLSSATNGAILGTSTFTYTIKNDDITPILTFVKPTFQQVKESAGTVTVRVQLTNPALTATSINVSAFGGNATSGVDYYLPSNTLTFPANTSTILNYSFPLTDDVLVEGLETIILRLTNATNNVTFINEYDTIDIVDNDLPVYTVSQMNKNDGLGYADSTGIKCEMRGIVYGPNVRPNGYQFFIHDRTGGIQVFRTTGTFGGYIPQDKDSVIVKGEIQQNNGQLQITNLDTVYKVGTGSYINPIAITSYSEANEGNLVTMTYMHLLNTTQWPTGSANAIVTIVDQNNKNFQTQIYRQTDIDSTQPTAYWFHITGILAQNDASFPWDSNYFIIPLSKNDYQYVYPRMSFTTSSDSVSESIGLDSIELNLQWAPRTVTTATVSFTGGSATFGQDFNFTSAVVTFPGVYAVNAKQKIGVLVIDDTAPETDETVTLTILGPSNNSTAVTPSVHTMVIKYNDGVGNGISKKSNSNLLSIFPNPGSSLINIKTELVINSIKLIDMNGRELLLENSKTINLQGIAKGIYLLQVETNEGLITNKVVVE